MGLSCLVRVQGARWQASAPQHGRPQGGGRKVPLERAASPRIAPTMGAAEAARSSGAASRWRACAGASTCAPVVSAEVGHDPGTGGDGSMTARFAEADGLA